MATSTVIKNLVSAVSGFSVGVAVISGLHTFDGTNALNNTKSNVELYVQDVQDSMNELEEFASSNKSISDANNQAYEQALTKANDNINQLISYIDNMTLNESELQNKVTQYESDIAELKTTIDGLQANVDSQVQAQVDDVIEQANAEIDKANSEVETTTSAIDTTLSSGAIDTSNITSNSIQSVSQEQLRVTDISGIVGGSSQTPTTPQEPSVQEPTTTPEKPSQTPDMDKSEETTNLSITNVEQLGTSSQFYYTFSDGKRFKVIMRDFKVYEVFATADSDGRQRVYDMNWTNDTSSSDYSTEFAEFMNNGYRDLIDNY